MSGSALSFGSPGPGDAAFRMWAEACFRTIESASTSDLQFILSEFSTTGSFTETRTFNASSASLADLRNVLATMIQDIKRGGQKAGYAD